MTYCAGSPKTVNPPAVILAPLVPSATSRTESECTFIHRLMGWAATRPLLRAPYISRDCLLTRSG